MPIDALCLGSKEGNLSIVGWFFFFFDEVMNGTCAVPPGWVFVFLFFFLI